MKTVRSSSILNDDQPKTAVEAILPWRRNSSFGTQAEVETVVSPGIEGDRNGVSSGIQDNDDLNPVLKQQEFPPWIGNREYFPNSYASPSNTMLQALDRDRNREGQYKIRPVFEIFAGTTNSENSSNDESYSDLIHLTEKQQNDSVAVAASSSSNQKQQQQQRSPPPPRDQSKEVNGTKKEAYSRRTTRRRGSSSSPTEDVLMKDMKASRRRESKGRIVVSSSPSGDFVTRGRTQQQQQQQQPKPISTINTTTTTTPSTTTLSNSRMKETKRAGETNLLTPRQPNNTVQTREGRLSPSSPVSFSSSSTSSSHVIPAVGSVSSSPSVAFVFPARPSSRQEAVTAVNPGFMPDTDDSDEGGGGRQLDSMPITKL